MSWKEKIVEDKYHWMLIGLKVCIGVFLAWQLVELRTSLNEMQCRYAVEYAKYKAANHSATGVLR